MFADTNTEQKFNCSNEFVKDFWKALLQVLLLYKLIASLITANNDILYFVCLNNSGSEFIIYSLQ